MDRTARWTYEYGLNPRQNPLPLFTSASARRTYEQMRRVGGGGPRNRLPLSALLQLLSYTRHALGRAASLAQSNLGPRTARSGIIEHWSTRSEKEGLTNFRHFCAATIDCGIYIKKVNARTKANL